ncbi:hypothetical protein DSO57_1034274 [Entomophthora muscae]|uniref:Uncharacterized protein n=1 Tax=Entomophthora muscae TaxID=34485 RepID=A0ACC2SZS2_9FUNG|nr:hypothetical protein DSO57_1034274 [Entomophthora muscae]
MQQDKDQSLIPLSSECCSKDEKIEKDLQEAESVVFPISQVEKESLVEKITEILHPDEMQEPQDLPLPTVALVSSIADELYDKLLVDQSLWEEDPT